jgi:hypothetical protein
MPITLICPTCENPFPRNASRVLKPPHQNFCSIPCRPKSVYPKCYNSFEERFWARVNKDTCLGETCGCHNGIGHCWPWMGSRSGRGYGLVWADGKLVPAHRVASTLTDPLMRPAEIHSLHRCDNPVCARPDHVFHGTHTDNMRDRETKERGQHLKGEQHWNAKVTEEHVMIIRALRSHYRQQVLGDVFGIRQNHVSTIQLKVQRKEVIEEMDVDIALQKFHDRILVLYLSFLLSFSMSEK